MACLRVETNPIPIPPPASGTLQPTGIGPGIGLVHINSKFIPYLATRYSWGPGTGYTNRPRCKYRHG